MDYSHIIKSPIVTEKALKDRDSSRFHFWVHQQANKNQIKTAFITLFGHTPQKINTHILKGKLKTNWQTRKTRQKIDRKRAIITLKKGTKIDLLNLKSK